MDGVRHLGDRRAGVQRERLLVDGPVMTKPDPDEPGQRPDGVAEGVERRIVEDRDAQHVSSGNAAAIGARRVAVAPRPHG